MGVSDAFNNGKVSGAGLLIRNVKDDKKKLYVEIFCDNFIESEASGNSIVLVGNIEIYCGQMLNNAYHGYGEFTSFEKNISYKGNFANGTYSGYGKLVANGASYEGYFKDGLFSGYGSMLIQNNGLYYYEGQFLNGKRDGPGRE